MCGLYGFVGESSDQMLLAELARLADTRGGHAHGWATTQDTQTQLGPRFLADDLPRATLIGHARLATSGAYNDLRCAQPVRTGRWAVSHNGTVPNLPALLEAHALSMPDVDSGVLPALLATAATAGDITRIIEESTPGVPLALLALRDDGLFVAARRGHPLYTAEFAEGRYFCSLPFPGAALLPDQSVHVYQGRQSEALTLPSDVHLRRHTGGPQWTP